MKNKKILVYLILLIVGYLIGSFSVTEFFAKLTGEGRSEIVDFATTPTSGGYSKITDMQSAYNADAEIAKALEKMRNDPGKTSIIRRVNTSKRSVALAFDGLTDATSVQRILDLLKKYNVKATFFVDGIQTSEDPQVVLNIKKEGQKVENYTLAGTVKMENLSAERLINDFCRAQKIIKVTTDQDANLLKCNDTKYTDQLLQAAKSSGFKSVVESDAYFDAKMINSLSEAESFVSRIKPGSIVSVKLLTNVQTIKNEPGKTDLRPALEKKPGLKELPADTISTEKKMVIDAVEKLLVALQAANYTTVYLEDFGTNNIVSLPLKNVSRQKGIVNETKTKTGSHYFSEIISLIKEQFLFLFSSRVAYAAESEHNQTEEIKVISTVEPALSFTFAGLGDEKAVNDVLAKLAQLGIKATFFVSEAEMERQPGLLKKIISERHEIGLAIKPKGRVASDEIRIAIMRALKTLEEKFGVSTNMVKQPYGALTAETKQAVNAADCILIGHSINVVQQKHKDYQSSNQVMSEIFGEYAYSLRRGQIVHFRMDFYTNPWLVGNLIEAIKKTKVDNIAYVISVDSPNTNRFNDSQYIIKPVGKILNNTDFIYQYPVDPANIPTYLKNKEVMADIIKKTGLLAEFSKRYIGSKYVSIEDGTLDGFSKMEERRLDKSGLIYTDDNVIFFTFDDWGTDSAINKLLYVLYKHKVTGTFFVITRNVPDNPNLLRAIAVEGHEIGSHSDRHLPMNVLNPKTGKRGPSQTKAEYIEDYAVSYQKLLDVVGDIMTIEGKPILTRFFRPPTLVINKTGVEALFETGYERIINGSYTTQDYNVKNVNELVKRLKAGIYTEKGTLKKGAILIMHMSDNTEYTAVALDILLTANEAKEDSDPSKFKVGKLSDYLTDDYSQIARNRVSKLNNQTQY